MASHQAHQAPLSTLIIFFSFLGFPEGHKNRPKWGSFSTPTQDFIFHVLFFPAVKIHKDMISRLRDGKAIKFSPEWWETLPKSTLGCGQMKRVSFLLCILWLYDPFQNYKRFFHIEYEMHILWARQNFLISESFSQKKKKKKNYSCGLQLFGESFWNITF